MARQQVIQIQCDRCKRVSLRPVQAEKTRPDFEACFLGTELKYADLCETCTRAIASSFKNMTEWEREVKQSLLGPAVSDNQAAPLDVAPDYTPPKPHSAAGAKRS